MWIGPFDKVAHCECASYALYLCIGTTSNLRGHLTIQNAKLKSFRRIETGELLCNQVSRRPIFISSLPMQKNNFVKFLNVSEVRVPFEWIVLFRLQYQQSRHGGHISHVDRIVFLFTFLYHRLVYFTLFLQYCHGVFLNFLFVSCFFSVLSNELIVFLSHPIVISVSYTHCYECECLTLE